MKSALALFLLSPLLAPAASIWVEGEQSAKNNVDHHGWYDSAKKDLLSGGGWISHYGAAAGEASYEVEVAAAGTYTIWARLNPVASEPSWRVGTGPWAKVNTKEVRQQQNIAGDGKIDHRFIAWVKLGVVPLNAGQTTISFRWEGGAQNSGGLDCFCLTTDAWVPQGTLQPETKEVAAAGSGESVSASEAIWIEGEAPTKQKMVRHPWWYDQVKKDVLSGGDWISNYDKDKEGTAEYAFKAEVADSYALWVRANPSVGAKLSWQLDGGAWTAVDFKDARGEQNIAADNKPDMRFLAWVKAAEVKLTPGQHTITWKMHSGAEKTNHGGLDCFVFTRIPFVPQGAQKPSRPATTGAPEAWYPLLADEDTFDPRSVIDMSKYIPAPAGQFGFLKAVGDQLKFEKAKTAQKFWGVGANVEPGRYTREQLTRRAKYLRKFGINVVRQHPVFDELTTNGVLDPKKLDEYDWWFAELKKHGIYSGWSVFYHFTVGPEDGYPAELLAELPKHGGHRGDTYGLITGSPKLWEIRSRVLTQLLQHKNPYTGLRYVDDPALVTVEMQNEDSIFFWNPLGELSNPKGKYPRHAQLLRERFAAWVKAKYETDDALKTAWGQLRNGDSVNAKEIAIMSPWELDGPGPRGPFAGQTRRAGDFIQCLAEMQRGFYEDCRKVIRAAGFQGVTITTAWQVGGAASDAANLWTDTAGDMIDRHNYAGGGAGGHGIAEGKLNNESHLRTPGGGIFSVGMKQVGGKPFCVTEWTQSAPNQWKSECAPIMALYGLGLQGWDASWHFIQSGTRIGDGWPGMSSYSTDTPAYIGQFPALSLAVYRGDIKEAPVAASRPVGKKEIFSGTDPLKQDSTKGGYDAKTLVNNGGTPPEYFGVGRVLVDFIESSTSKPAAGADGKEALSFWNAEQKVAKSMTGELTWDYGQERIVVASPRTQGIIGKAGTETVALPALAATVKTPFVSLLISSLDGEPIATSRHFLITALARDRQTGTRYSADARTLEAAGTAPLRLEPVVAKLKFATPPKSIVPCDHYGVPMSTSVPVEADGSFTIDGRYRAYYYEGKR